MLRSAVLVLVATAGTARADVVEKLEGGGAVNWSKGVVTATAVGLANRHAPSPASARAASRRRAEDAARAALVEVLPKVRWVAGARPADLAAKSEWLAARAVVTDATLNPDGSWRVTLGLPIEAIRLGLGEPRKLDKDGDRGEVAAIVVDARKLARVEPVGGVALGAAGKAGVTLWLDKDPPAALVGAKPKRLVAKEIAGGVIRVDGSVPDAAGALIVVVVRRP